MESKSTTLKKVETITSKLNVLIATGGEVKRENIKEAEEISYNNLPPSNITYDEYGFINKNKEDLKKNK